MDLILVMKERVRDQNSEIRSILHRYLLFTSLGLSLLCVAFYAVPRYESSDSTPMGHDSSMPPSTSLGKSLSQVQSNFFFFTASITGYAAWFVAVQTLNVPLNRFRRGSSPVGGLGSPPVSEHLGVLGKLLYPMAYLTCCGGALLSVVLNWGFACYAFFQGVHALVHLYYSYLLCGVLIAAR
jgi:hypothetical protein